MTTLFLDTNILLYAVSAAPDEAGKRCIAEEIVQCEDWSFSVQVMQEFFSNAIRPTPRGPGLSPEAAGEYLELLLPDHPCQAMDASLILEATRLYASFRIHWWDAPILAAARRLGCTYVFSEDFSHGQTYDGVTVLNPFLELPA